MSLLSPENVPDPVRVVVRALKAAGHQAFLVGGCVRDLKRGQRPKDFDVATSARPEQVKQAVRPAKVIPTGIEHGTVTVVHSGHHVEVTTFRAESDYVDGRRPSKVEFHEEIEADLSRRDFTINAMAWDPDDDRLVDPFGGEADLDARVVRCVRSAHERFSEDGLRALRAVRFATVLDFALDPDTQAAIRPTLHVFRKVAGERIQQEFVKLLLAEGRAPRGLALLRDTGLLAEFFPEAVGADFEAVGRAPLDATVRLALLCLQAPAPREVVLRLKFPGKVAEEAGALVALHPLPAASASDAELRRWAARVTPERVPALFALAAAREPAPAAERAALQARVQALLAANPPLTARQLALDGKAIMALLGVGPSPAIGHATRHLLELVLEDPRRNSRESLTAALKAWTLPQ